MLPLLRPRAPDEDGELPQSELLRLGGPRDHRDDEVHHSPDAAGGSQLRAGPVFGGRVLAGGGLGPVSVERRAVRGPGQAEQAGPLCHQGGRESQQEEVQGGARQQTKAAAEKEMREEAVWLQELSGCQRGGDINNT